MSAHDNGGPAFPLADSCCEYGGTNRSAANGMTLRDYFISQVQVPSDLSRAWGEAVVGPYPKQPNSDCDLPFSIEVAKWWASVSAAYRCMEADAMLAARKEGGAA